LRLVYSYAKGTFMVNKLFALVTYHCFRQHRKKVVRQGLIMAWNVR
jgi:stalled ribosome alternative rescue factor ArfA